MLWISIKDRLPPKYKKIIIFDKKMGVDCGIYHFENEFDIITNGGWDGCRNVTHWMPLPPPPNNIIKLLKSDQAKRVVFIACDDSNYVSPPES